ncbi:MAG: tetraacyldisaccharide 4'-kinase [Gammaproteobacteria bacterium]|nr:MAG: tetraacyldisaccharide 4'-kinase [Gammaproteobacteria bacterium]
MTGAAGETSMRASIENRLLKHWYGTHRPPWYLRMLEPVYRAAYRRTEKSQRAGSGVYRPALPLIIVGNITAGGSGKTPLVIALGQLAIEMNLKPGIASTGYGRLSRETFVVHADSDTNTCGDEPVLLAKRSGVPVVVAVRRSDAIKKLHAMGVDLVISDDGLQQADLRRDMEICVVDGDRGLGNGHLIPAGPLREPADRLAQVDFVVSNGEWAARPAALSVNTMRLQAAGVQSLDDVTRYTLAEFRDSQNGIPLHAVAGIGNPARFFKLLDQHGIKVIPHRFADHHRYKKQDFISMSGPTAIIMTEKDAVKCRGLGLENAWYVPVETLLPDIFKQTFKDRLAMLSKDSN